jgi:hypothetical protein
LLTEKIRPPHITLQWRRQSEFSASLRTTLRKELMSVVALGSVVAGAELAINEVVERKMLFTSFLYKSRAGFLYFCTEPRTGHR